jgi:hypothetical protein
MQYPGGYVAQQYPGYMPQQFGPITATLINPMVTTIKDAVSAWDWDFILPSQPVQPNPIPLQTPGTLTFQVAIRKNARGSLPPEGLFNIQANLQITTSAQNYGIIISELGVTLQGQNMLTQPIRSPAVSCTPNQFQPLPPGFNQMFCTVLFQNVVLYSQPQGQGGFTFQGYTLTPYVTWTPNPSTITPGTQPPIAAPFMGYPMTLTIPQSTSEDCATLTQNFDTGRIFRP